MDDKPLYVTLEGFVPTDGDDSTLLVKKVPADYLNKSVYDTVQKLLDTTGDDMNDAYNANEKETAKIIGGWFKDMNKNPDNYAIAIAALDVDNNEVPLKLEDQMSHYDNILKTKTETDPETNASESYKFIDLLAQRNVPNGYDTIDTIL